MVTQSTSPVVQSGPWGMVDPETGTGAKIITVRNPMVGINQQAILSEQVRCEECSCLVQLFFLIEMQRIGEND